MSTTEKTHQFVMKSVFEAALKKDINLRHAVEKFSGDLHFDGDELIFTLPALFKFAMFYIQQGTIAQITNTQIEYLAFRKIVYQSKTNHYLRELKATVVIESQHVIHDERWYRLMVLK